MKTSLFPKSARTFQCRDALWEAFQQMASELQCSPDYLINEAMKQYLKQRDEKRNPATSGLGQSGACPPSTIIPTSHDLTTDSEQNLPSISPSTLAVPHIPVTLPFQQAVPSVRDPVSSSPPLSSSSSQAPPVAPESSLAVTQPIQPDSALSSPLHPLSITTPLPALKIIYEGEKTVVSKTPFIIGRGKQAVDLVIRDPNVSRQHAMIESRDGAYFLTDMNSTNGIEHQGKHIQKKQIFEGDAFSICNHKITFSYC
ncbi:FHA domain-containing protein [Pajaroellobacter abortibovis]|uniref:FHA domain-containing protein n=1 Tax=Pajaroellobacter abortibovis TaxID=1882918 RepID=A0A1L6MYB8_9BACT|nr:FHA domain-containing protein [Pajaroellobacter abortibovis]APS00563.1 hypothetical protein BCY86_07670 [Pajaroellobacter abortibovis]